MALCYKIQLVLELLLHIAIALDSLSPNSGLLPPSTDLNPTNITQQNTPPPRLQRSSVIRSMASEPTFATESDASRIADIHMAAFGSNPLFLAQFPTPTIRHQLRSRIAQKAADDIRDPHIAVLVVRDQNRVVSFAKWSLPVEASAIYVEAPWVWPEGTDLAVLKQWTEMVEGAKQRAVGGLPAYRRLFGSFGASLAPCSLSYFSS